MDNQSLEVLIVIYVDGNLVLNLPSTRNLEEVDSQLLIWVSSNLILQARDGSGPARFNGIAKGKGEN